MTAAASPGGERIGDLLVKEGLISREQLQQALAEQRQNGTRVGYNLVKLGFIQENELTRTLARQFKMPAVDLSKFEVDTKIIKLVPTDLATKNLVLPLKRDGRTLTVAMADPTNLGVIEDLKFITRYDIFPVIAGEFTLRNVIEKHYESNEQQMSALLSEIESLEDGEVEVVEDKEEEMSATALAAAVDDAPVVKLINAILTNAVKMGASDIHFECFEKELRVRYRIDGHLEEVMKPPKKMQPALISRFKIMSSLNIAERRVPQDGRATVTIGDRPIDLRISTLPTSYGERVVIRLLDNTRHIAELEDTGMPPEVLQRYLERATRANGMILLTGPTGSGKTTTLYSTLRRVGTAGLNIMTIEDPIEYELSGMDVGMEVGARGKAGTLAGIAGGNVGAAISQSQVNLRKGVTFATGLRHILRQDPDVVMVGEIRDAETARIAIQSSMTGHLVFSTLHTNDAASAVTRLIDLGIEPYLVGAALSAILAQRLVRTLHAPCEGRGCAECMTTGFRGRTGLFELLVIDEQIRELVATNAPLARLREMARQGGMRTLQEDGERLVAAGRTTVDEVRRVVQGAW